MSYAAVAAQLKQGYTKVKKRVKAGGAGAAGAAIADHIAALEALVETPASPTQHGEQAGMPRGRDLGRQVEAVCLVNLARMHCANGDVPSEAACYKRAGLLFLEAELARYDTGAATLGQDLARGVLASNLAVAVFTNLAACAEAGEALGLSSHKVEAYCVAMKVAHTLERLQCLDTASDYYGIAARVLGPATPAVAAGADLARGSAEQSPSSASGSEAAAATPATSPSILKLSATLRQLHCLFMVWDVEAAFRLASELIAPYEEYLSGTPSVPTPAVAATASAPASETAVEAEAKAEASAGEADAAPAADNAADDDDDDDSFFEADAFDGDVSDFVGFGAAKPRALPASIRGVLVAVVLAKLALRELEDAGRWRRYLTGLSAPAALAAIDELLRWAANPYAAAREQALSASPPFDHPLHAFLYHKVLVSAAYPLSNPGD